MRPFLIFTLWAPMAAMGDIAVGERRMGADRPAKSAIIGLLAAALGIERRDEDTHAALAAAYGFAVRVDRKGTLIEDYHTVQTPPARKGKRWPTRADELAEPRLETLLSLRDYRAQSHLTIAVWLRGTAPYTLAALADALVRPRFVLFVGRKSCPLGLPPAPHIIEATTLAQAFDRFDSDMAPSQQQLRRSLGVGSAEDTRREVYADVDARPWLGDGLREHQIVRRRDDVASRRRWQFGLRDELVAVPTASLVEPD